MNQLSTLDAVFLHLETPEMPMHVGALQILQRPPPRVHRKSGRKSETNRGGPAEPYVDALRRVVASRLHRAPMLTRALVPLPLDMGNPFWQDGVAVDLHWHVRSYRLPAPGGPRQLDEFIARHAARLMDRSRPLWQLLVVEGLDESFGPDAVAVYTKLHHAAVDGNAAVALGNVLFDTEPDPASSLAPQGHALRLAQTPPPATRALLGAAAWNQVAHSVRLAGALPKAGRSLAAVLRQWIGLTTRGTGTAPLQIAPRTFLNVTVSRKRAYGTARVPLGELKEIGHACGATVNDLVLWLVSTALREYVERHERLPDRPLLAGVPVSLRPEGDTNSNTQATLTSVNLATHIDDPRLRLAAIQDATAAMKDTIGRMRPLLAIELPSLGLPWLLRGAASIYASARLAERLPGVANLVVSNVAGSRVPLYLAGARMVATYPVSIIVHGVGLNITVQSHDGALGFGCVGCGRALPDIALLASGIERAFDALRAAAMPVRIASRPPAKPLARRRTPTKHADAS